MNIGQYIGVLIGSMILGTAGGAILMTIFDFNLEHEDSYRLVYVVCALLLAPYITKQIEKQ